MELGQQPLLYDLQQTFSWTEPPGRAARAQQIISWLVFAHPPVQASCRLLLALCALLGMSLPLSLSLSLFPLSTPCLSQPAFDKHWGLLNFNPSLASWVFLGPGSITHYHKQTNKQLELCLVWQNRALRAGTSRHSAGAAATAAEAHARAPEQQSCSRGVLL